MFENIAAIDIGSTGVRMVKARIGLKGIQIKSLSYEDIDAAAENRTEAVTAALKQMFAEDSPAGCKIISDLPMENVIIRSITFPFDDPKKIAEAIPFEAEENVPFDINDLAMSFKYLGGGNEHEGRILLAAAKKDYVYDIVGTFQAVGLAPTALGLEADSLAACYNSLCTVQNETVIQVHIGGEKSIINIIGNGSLLYTRASSAAANHILQNIAAYLKMPFMEARNLTDSLIIDVFSEDNTVKRNDLKTLGLTKAQMKKIFGFLTSGFEEIAEQIKLTVQACKLETKLDPFNRILISGSGANLPGVESFISKSMELQTAALPFLPEYNNPKANLMFHHALGMIYAYVNKKGGAINFLKDEFIPDINNGHQTPRRVYYLAAFFLGLTAFVLIINLIISLILGTNSSAKYNDVLAERYKKYFTDSSNPEDPIAAAKDKLRKATRELESITSVTGEQGSTLLMLKDLLADFEAGDGFELRSLVINESIIRIDGSTSSGSSIDRFKEELQKSGKFDSVSLNISSSRKGNATFTLTIQQKKKNKKS